MKLYPAIKTLALVIPCMASAQTQNSFRDIIKVPANGQFTPAATNMTDYIQGMNWKGLQLLVAPSHMPAAVANVTVALADIPAASVATTYPAGDCVRYIWSRNNCSYQADVLISATVLTIRPVLQPGENLYDRVKAVVPSCIRDFQKLKKFDSINWPASWNVGGYYKFGDLTEKPLAWEERLELEMLTDGIKVYLPCFGQQLGLTWINSWKYFEGMRVDEQRPEIRARFDRNPVE